MVAVLAEKSGTREASNGSKYGMWTLSDLAGAETRLMLFGDAFAAHWKESEGAILAVVAPKASPPSSGYAGGPCLSIDKPPQVFKLGTAADFGLCKAERKDGRPCGAGVNARACEYCPRHAAAALARLRGDGRKETANGGNHAARVRRAAMAASAGKAFNAGPSGAGGGARGRAEPTTFGATQSALPRLSFAPQQQRLAAASAAAAPGARAALSSARAGDLRSRAAAGEFSGGARSGARHLAAIVAASSPAPAQPRAGAANTPFRRAAVAVVGGSGAAHTAAGVRAGASAGHAKAHQAAAPRAAFARGAAPVPVDMLRAPGGATGAAAEGYLAGYRAGAAAAAAAASASASAAPSRQTAAQPRRYVLTEDDPLEGIAARGGGGMGRGAAAATTPGARDKMAPRAAAAAASPSPFSSPAAAFAPRLTKAEADAAAARAFVAARMHSAGDPSAPRLLPQPNPGRTPPPPMTQQQPPSSAPPPPAHPPIPPHAAAAAPPHAPPPPPLPSPLPPPPSALSNHNALLPPLQPTAAPKRSFASAFGDITSGADADRGSLHANLADDAADVAMHAALDALAKREGLHDAASKVTQLLATAWRCSCGALSERRLPSCVAEGHGGSLTRAAKKFFVCKGCRRRTHTLDVSYPLRPCSGCGGRDFDKAAAAPAGGPRKVDVHDGVACREAVRPRGEEHAFSLKEG